ncbi:21816_t:CDS:1 [Gigaspora rosea]|nr:21816_t:CDS:1 [Gigaspora rosea]
MNDVVGINGTEGYTLRKLACEALKLSANDDPPTSFSDMNGIGGDFDKWARKKEYRG